MTRSVACAMVRQDGAWLAFRHPLAGCQVVKGGIEPGETPEAAALRELREEAGVPGKAARLRGWLDEGLAGERWALVSVTAPRLPERWSHRCADDGGHDFAFFWHRPGADETAFAAPFRRVLREAEAWSR